VEIIQGKKGFQAIAISGNNDLRIAEQTLWKCCIIREKFNVGL
jgi:hypothetical protein